MRVCVRFSVALLAMLSFCDFALAFEKAPVEIVRALGTKRGKPISSGLVFIDGKYIKPPYRVTRAGNQILLNDHPVSGQLISWEKFLETQPPSNLKVTEVEDGTSEEEPAATATPEKDGDDPAAPKDGGNAPPPAEEEASARPVVTIVETRLAADADDLDDFNPKDAPAKMKLSDIPPDSDADKARQKRAEEEKKTEAEEEKEDSEEKEKEEGEPSSAESAEDSQNDDEVDPASPEGEAAAKKAAAAAKKAMPRVEKKTRKVTTLAGKFEENARSRKLVKTIDSYRARLESTLRRGGFLCFGTNPAKKYLVGLRTDSVATNELLKKLPELMAKAAQSEAFCDEVRSAGLMSFINLQVAKDLYRHKMDSVFLKQRRREIAEEAKFKK